VVPHGNDASPHARVGSCGPTPPVRTRKGAEDEVAQVGKGQRRRRTNDRAQRQQLRYGPPREAVLDEARLLPFACPYDDSLESTHDAQDVEGALAPTPGCTVVF
jgi:hypothetical protein